MVFIDSVSSNVGEVVNILLMMIRSSMLNIDRLYKKCCVKKGYPSPTQGRGPRIGSPLQKRVIQSRLLGGSVSVSFVELVVRPKGENSSSKVGGRSIEPLGHGGTLEAGPPLSRQTVYFSWEDEAFQGILNHIFSKNSIIFMENSFGRDIIC